MAVASVYVKSVIEIDFFVQRNAAGKRHQLFFGLAL